jgi:hypothetical protein
MRQSAIGIWSHVSATISYMRAICAKKGKSQDFGGADEETHFAGDAYFLGYHHY